MNDRLKELMLEAGYAAPEIAGRARVLAELIVQECLLALEPDTMLPAINYDVEQKFYQRSANKIKKHFGVE